MPGVPHGERPRPPHSAVSRYASPTPHETLLALPFLALAFALTACDASEPEAVSQIPATRDDNTMSFTVDGTAYRADMPKENVTGGTQTQNGPQWLKFDGFKQSTSDGLMRWVAFSASGITGPGTYSGVSQNGFGVDPDADIRLFEYQVCSNQNLCGYGDPYYMQSWTLDVEG